MWERKIRKEVGIYKKENPGPRSDHAVVLSSTRVRIGGNVEWG
jgi:hypothetical protein